jgi:ribosomal protein L11 methyltransferase
MTHSQYTPQETYRLRVHLPAERREAFFDWAWSCVSGILGVHEGTLLAEQAHRLGFETEAWVLDKALAPENRDWIRELKVVDAELYFGSEADAQAAVDLIRAEHADVQLDPVEIQKPRDWDAEWKASFKGVTLAPYWQVLPPWEKASDPALRVIRLTPGAGFGTGTHETTQLCLTSLGDWVNAVGSLKGRRVLDFGSGSGILAIAAALLGAEVDAVEIDPLAIENARHNAEMNQVEDRIHFRMELPEATGAYDLILANILKPVLIEFGPRLLERLSPKACCLILSGLMEPDGLDVEKAYSTWLSDRKVSCRKGVSGDWRSLSWNISSKT